MESSIKSITLYYREGSSDKIYQASIQSNNNGFIVCFAYGRRGSTLVTGVKTPIPVNRPTAQRIFDKLVAEKKAKGYTPGADGTPYHQTEREIRDTDIHCQLLNPIDAAQANALLDDPEYCIQEKFNGRRLLIWKEGNTVTGINRRGLAVSLPETIVASAQAFSADFIMDGEAVGEQLHAFDLLTLNGTDLRPLSYQYRYLELMEVLFSKPKAAIRLVPCTTLPGQKRAMFEKLRADGKEGVVFKHFGAPYTAGRPASGGTQFKYKFYETASFIVGSVNKKRSVSLILVDGEKRVVAGNVAIPVNHEVPEEGAVVECRYLYAFQESGAVFQPVYHGLREDISQEECVVGQLKYQPGPSKEVE